MKETHLKYMTMSLNRLLYKPGSQQSRLQNNANRKDAQTTSFYNHQAERVARWVGRSASSRRDHMQYSQRVTDFLSFYTRYA